jgi:hypothetical protein
MAGEYVKTEAAQKAERRFYPKRDAAANYMARLTWALNFAQSPVEDFTPGQKLDAQTALAVFPGGWADAAKKENGQSQRAIFSEQQMLDAHEKLSTMFEDWLTKRVVFVKPAPPEWQIFNGQKGPALDFIQVDNITHVQHLIARIAVLLVFYGDRIRRCTAPAKRGKGRVCGRLYAGSHKKLFCSQRCQLRAGKQASRKRAQTKGGHHAKKKKVS